MENELRYYLNEIRKAMYNCDKPFIPQYLVTATQLPTGFIELAVNQNAENIKAKIDYILSAYDEEMRLKTNPAIIMKNIMLV